MFDISYIIVSWNAKEFLRKCLNSIYNTTKKAKFEVVVVDNASSDGSPEMVKKVFPQVNLICTGANLGFAKANNIGIQSSQGRYACLVNSDILVLDNCVDTILSYMDSNPTIGMLGPKILNPDLTLQRSYKDFPTVWNSFSRSFAIDTLFSKSRFPRSAFSNYITEDTIVNVDVLIGAFWFIRRSALKDVGLLDENFFMYSEDKDWCKRFKQKGWGVIYFPKAKIIHYGGRSSKNSPVRFYIELQRSSLQYWKKHFGIIGQGYYFVMTVLYEINRIIGYSIFYIALPSHRSHYKYKLNRSIKCLHWLIISTMGKFGITKNISHLKE